MAFQSIGNISDFPDGRGVEVRLGPRRIVIFRLGSRLYALKNLCPHEGDRLHRLPPRDGAAVCVGHGWRFDLETGKCIRGDSDARVAVYPVKLEDDRVAIDVG